MSWPWNELGLSGPAGLPEIRRAYAQRLKTTHPEEDPEGFQRLHTAYQEASRFARRAARTAQAKPEEPPARPSAPPEGEEAAERETEADWDYGELLEEQRAPERPPEKTGQPEETGWSYDELLEERGEERSEPKEEPHAHTTDWDYERLFAEGEAEAQEARRRKLEELRQKNQARYKAQEREQRRRTAEEEESWSAVMAAAHALELLHSSGAPLPQWRRFLNDPVFWNVRANLDFIFALEDFLEQHPDMSPDIRRAIFSAYGLEKGPGYPVYKRLYRLLNMDRKEKRRMSKAKSRWRAAWRSYPAWRKAGIVICFSILAVFFLLGWAVNLRTAYHDFMERKAEEKWEAHILDWLEEDYGEPFTLAVRDNIYAPESDPTLYFWVTRDGERTESQPGYRTNYPHILVKRAMEDFAEEWDLNLKLDGAGGFSGNIGDAPGAYLFDLPLKGAEEAVAALGEQVRELETQDWYRAPSADGQEVEYQIFLCHGDLSFYDAISTENGGFDPEEALSRYETVGPAFCRYILEHSGLIEKHMGKDAYVLLDRGTAELNGNSFFLVTALEKESQEPKANYLMASGGGMLFCLPEGGLEEVKGVVDLYRGSASHLQLDGVGLVMVWDQIK